MYCFVVLFDYELMAISAGNMKLKTKHFGGSVTSTDPLQEYIREHDPSELFIYDFDCISIATDTFSNSNKLGEGGFGPVYKVNIFFYKFFRLWRCSSTTAVTATIV